MNTASVIIVAFAALLVIYAIRGTILKVKGKSKSSCCGTPEVISRQVDDTDESHYPYSYDLTIDGMKCSNCARTVENTLNRTDGVWAKVNLGKKEAHILAKHPMQQEDFSRAIAKAGYTLTAFQEC